jgi:hypothetical protein
MTVISLLLACYRNPLDCDTWLRLGSFSLINPYQDIWGRSIVYRTNSPKESNRLSGLFYQWSGQKSGGDSAVSPEFVIAGMIFHLSRVQSELLHKYIEQSFVEVTLRDSKQFTGLLDYQARSRPNKSRSLRTCRTIPGPPTSARPPTVISSRVSSRGLPMTILARRSCFKIQMMTILP